MSAGLEEKQEMYFFDTEEKEGCSHEFLFLPHSCSRLAVPVTICEEMFPINGPNLSTHG
jgi:hypothetical protein